MKENIYEYFNCNTNEELFEMLVNKDEQVHELKKFYEIMSQVIDRNVLTFLGSHSGGVFLNTMQAAPEKGTVTVAALNHKNEVLNWSNFPASLPYKDSVKSFFNEKATSLVLFGHDEDIDYIFEVRESLQLSGMIVPDFFIIDPDDKNQLYSYASAQINEYESFDDVFRGVMPHPIDDSSYLMNTKEVIQYEEPYVVSNNLLDTNVTNDIQSLNGLDVFNNYYIENVLLNKNIVIDEEEVIKTFKVGLQDLPQENVYMVTYNDEYSINSVEQISIGSLASVSVPPQQMMSRFLKDDVYGAVLIHNHPSGHSDPSDADKGITLGIMDMAESLDKEFIEHYIVSYSGHTKISDYNEKLRSDKLKVYSNIGSDKLSLSLNDRLDILEKKTPKFKSHEVKEKER